MASVEANRVAESPPKRAFARTRSDGTAAAWCWSASSAISVE